MTELSNRLQTVASFVNGGKRVADIGCDHGFVSIYLLESKRASHVIAMDVNKGPLMGAKEHILEAGFENQIEVRLSDGADALKNGEADTFVIAGMGGDLMTKILKKAFAHLDGIDELILQPQAEIFKVREYLWELGFAIVAEKMVYEEGKYYQIIHAKKDGVGDTSVDEWISQMKSLLGDTYATKEQLIDVVNQFGPLLLLNKDEVLKQFVTYRIKKQEEIAKKIQANAKNKNDERVKEVERESTKLAIANKILHS